MPWEWGEVHAQLLNNSRIIQNVSSRLGGIFQDLYLDPRVKPLALAALGLYAMHRRRMQIHQGGDASSPASPSKDIKLSKEDQSWRPLLQSRSNQIQARSLHRSDLIFKVKHNPLQAFYF